MSGAFRRVNSFSVDRRRRGGGADLGSCMAGSTMLGAGTDQVSLGSEQTENAEDHRLSSVIRAVEAEQQVA